MAGQADVARGTSARGFYTLHLAADHCLQPPCIPRSCWKNAFWFVTLLYPRCAMTALQLFGWQKLDIGTFLKADFSIMVRW